MENWLHASAPLLLKTGCSTALIFIVMIAITRVSGLRTFAKMSSIDFASTIAIGSILAAVIMNDDQSLLKGGVALAAVVIFQSIYSYLNRRSNAFKKAAQNEPILLMVGEEILSDNLRKVHMQENTLMAKLREANVLRMSEVKAVVFETTGDISVLHGEEDITLDDRVLEGVRRDDQS